MNIAPKLIHDEMRLIRMKDGGYLVTLGATMDDMKPDLFACSTLPEALDYIRAQMTPEERKAA